MSVSAAPATLPPPDAPPLEWALAYATRGWLVFPVHGIRADGVCSCGDPDCDDAGKHPLTAHGLQDATTDAARLERWWRQWPGANIGIRTGPESGFFVVDVDPDKGGDDTLAELERAHGRLPDTVEALTGGGGRHLLYQHPGWYVPNGTGSAKHPGRFGPGVDIRGNGGYIVAAPSRHLSGRGYFWELSGHPDETAIAAAPAWVLEPLRSAPGRNGNGKGPVDVAAVLGGVAEGERDEELFRTACKLRRLNIPREVAEDVILRAAANCRPPFPADDALKKVASAWKYEPEPEELEVDVGPERTNGHAASTPAVADAIEAEPVTLAELIAVFRRWLFLDDDGPVYAVLAAVAANLIAGDPLWLMLVGPSSGGKTEIINAVIGLPDVHAAATLTEGALLSGTPKRDKDKTAKGGLLREVGPFGILAIKDFTSILSMNRDPRAQLLAALREIYDGSWTRHVGVDGGRQLAWQGKLGLVAGCTAAVDSFHAVMATMGERFLLYRLPAIDPQEQATRALQNTGRERELRAALAGAVAGLFRGLQLPETPPELTTEETERLVALASLTARGRSGVERDRYTREIELILDPEAPARLAQSLRRLYGGLVAIGLDRPRAWAHVVKVGLDCLPKVRRGVFDVLADAGEGLCRSTTEVAEALGYPTNTVRRALEDLTVHGVVTRLIAPKGGADQWRFTAWAWARYAAVAPAGGVSAMSVPQ